MSSPGLIEERLAELLVEETTEGVNASDALELRGLLARHADVDPTSIERTAAAVLLAGTATDQVLPPSLRRTLELAGDAFVAQHFPVPGVTIRRAGKHVASFDGRPARGGWYAAAACLVLAVLAWWPRLVPQQLDSDAGRLRSATTDAARDREAMRVGGAAIVREWSATQEPAAHGATGDVVWDGAHQRGYMRIRGLKANDPRHSQYQLWIFDRARGDQYPVDGGVFDMPADREEVLIPIDARLPVTDPALFAVTIEQPGGVVVSSREHIVLLARGTESS